MKRYIVKERINGDRIRHAIRGDVVRVDPNNPGLAQKICDFLNKDDADKEAAGAGRVFKNSINSIADDMGEKGMSPGYTPENISPFTREPNKTKNEVPKGKPSKCFIPEKDRELNKGNILEREQIPLVHKLADKIKAEQLNRLPAITPPAPLIFEEMEMDVEFSKMLLFNHEPPYDRHAEGRDRNKQ